MSVCRISGVTISVLVWSAVDIGFQVHVGSYQRIKIDICCFSAKDATLRNKSRDWLVQNLDNVSEWSDMFTDRLLFQ